MELIKLEGRSERERATSVTEREIWILDNKGECKRIFYRSWRRKEEVEGDDKRRSFVCWLFQFQSSLLSPSRLLPRPRSAWMPRFCLHHSKSKSAMQKCASLVRWVLFWVSDSRCTSGEFNFPLRAFSILRLFLGFLQSIVGRIGAVNSPKDRLNNRGGNARQTNEKSFEWDLHESWIWLWRDVSRLWKKEN